LLRPGKRRDGERLYPAMSYPSFANVADDDVGARYAYLMHGLKPTARRGPETHLDTTCSVAPYANACTLS
jgi:hypothetical protein